MVIISAMIIASAVVVTSAIIVNRIQASATSGLLPLLYGANGIHFYDIFEGQTSTGTTRMSNRGRDIATVNSLSIVDHVTTSSSSLQTNVTQR
ncbi:hypothetical protein EVAR_5777_1 [Eumeta japonica]|uniref:Uncharacterized protein n=1 Tax=Eumeta variegata TaxID=151549 RepID=A0A4C1T7D6_EUMVA|nr:hypothetical protein EVAR_5777_1 [Eumeta japonica]